MQRIHTSTVFLETRPRGRHPLCVAPQPAHAHARQHAHSPLYARRTPRLDHAESPSHRATDTLAYSQVEVWPRVCGRRQREQEADQGHVCRRHPSSSTAIGTAHTRHVLHSHHIHDIPPTARIPIVVFLTRECERPAPLFHVFARVDQRGWVRPRARLPPPSVVAHRHRNSSHAACAPFAPHTRHLTDRTHPNRRFLTRECDAAIPPSSASLLACQRGRATRTWRSSSTRRRSEEHVVVAVRYVGVVRARALCSLGPLCMRR